MLHDIYTPRYTGEWVIFILLILSLLFVLFTYLKFYLPAIRYQDTFTEKNIPISIIICARNEEENLNENLPFILHQDYPNYEIIVVNDCSTDNTEIVIDKYLKEYPHKLRKVNVPRSDHYEHGKKMAVFIGIKHAKNEHLVFTDADCKPASDQWLKKMASHFDAHKNIVLGYGQYKPINTFLNKLVRYDTLTIGLQYLSCAIQGNPYMGVGRNLAYTKSLFFQNKGFATHYHIPSGDDDLFVNETATSTNTAVCLHPDAFTISEPPLIFKHWLLQKARHFSTFSLYKPVHQLMLAWIYFSFLFYYFTIFGALLIPSPLWVYILLSILIKYSVQTSILHAASKKFKEKNIYLFAFFLEPVLIIFYFYVALYKKIKHL